mmetsp:Transcript_17577/g.53817  ORF Transcript_17577/g.53817 Transcript_17577/m.53817 type:complete len:204 (+) Transcript_17577:475-1086(+)
MAAKSARPVSRVSTPCSRTMASWSWSSSAAALLLASRSRSVALTASGEARRMCAAQRSAQGSVAARASRSARISSAELPLKQSRTFCTKAMASPVYSASAGTTSAPRGSCASSACVTKGRRSLTLGLSTLAQLESAARTAWSISRFWPTKSAASPSVRTKVLKCSSKPLSASPSSSRCEASGGLLPTSSSMSSSSTGCPETAR